MRYSISLPLAVLWIRFILIWIRLRVSVSDDYGSGSGSGSWPNLDKKSKFRNFLAFFWKEKFCGFPFVFQKAPWCGTYVKSPCLKCPPLGHHVSGPVGRTGGPKKKSFQGGKFDIGGFNIFQGKISISKGTAVRGEKGRKKSPKALGGLWGTTFRDL